MGLLIKPYTLSIVKGETKITIGSDKAKGQSYASSVTLKRNVNGSRSLSFKMYYQYHDIVNGGQKINPFIDDSNNSSILYIWIFPLLCSSNRKWKYGKSNF